MVQVLFLGPLESYQTPNYDQNIQNSVNKMNQMLQTSTHSMCQSKVHMYVFIIFGNY